jgi:hypothetical protein
MSQPNKQRRDKRVGQKTDKTAPRKGAGKPKAGGGKGKPPSKELMVWKPKAGPSPPIKDKGKGPAKGKGSDKPADQKKQSKETGGAKPGGHPHPVAAENRHRAVRWVAQQVKEGKTVIDVGGTGNRIKSDWCMHPHVTAADASNEIACENFCNHRVYDCIDGICEHFTMFDYAFLCNSHYYLTPEEMEYIVNHVKVGVYVIGHRFVGKKGEIDGCEWSRELEDGEETIMFVPNGGELYRHPDPEKIIPKTVSAKFVKSFGDTHVWLWTRSLVSAPPDVRAVVSDTKQSKVEVEMERHTLYGTGRANVGQGRAVWTNWFRRARVVEVPKGLVAVIMTAVATSTENNRVFALNGARKQFVAKNPSISPDQVEAAMAYIELIVEERMLRAKTLQVRAARYCVCFPSRTIVAPVPDEFPDTCLWLRDRPVIRKGAVFVQGIARCRESFGFYIGGPVAPTDVWVPRMCSHNSEVAIRSRGLMVPKVNSYHHYELRDSLQDVVEQLNGVTVVEMVTYLRQLKSGRARGVAQSATNGASRSTMMKAFVKREIYHGDKDPRLIQGASNYYIEHLGAAVWSFQKQWAEHTQGKWAELLAAHGFVMVYTSGLDADGLGDLWHAMSCGRASIDFDISRLDAHIRRRHTVDFQWCLETLTGVEDLFDTSVVKGITSDLHYYLVNSTLASGRPETSVLGTLVVRWIMQETFKAMRAEHPDFTLVGMGSGDDSKIACAPEYVQETRLIAMRIGRMMGFKLTGGEVNLDPMRGEYFSGLFWPVAGGKYVYGPKLGRFAARAYVMTREVAKEHRVAEVHAKALQFRRLVAPVPMLRDLNERVLRLTKTHVSAHRLAKYAVKHRPMSRSYEYGTTIPPEAVALLCDRYYSTPEEIYHEVQMLSAIELSDKLTSPFWQRCLERDM